MAVVPAEQAQRRSRSLAAITARLWHGRARHGTRSAKPAEQARPSVKPRQRCEAVAAAARRRGEADRRPDAADRAHRVPPLRLRPVVASSPAGPKSSAKRTPASARPKRSAFRPARKADGILQLVVPPAHAPLIQHVIPEIMERVNRFFGYDAVAGSSCGKAWLSRPLLKRAESAAIAQADPDGIGRQFARYRRSGAARGARIAGPRLGSENRDDRPDDHDHSSLSPRPLAAGALSQRPPLR